MTAAFGGGMSYQQQIVQKPEPLIVKAIYLTAYTAGSPNRRSELIDLIDQTELNAVVIDVKDSTGKVFYPSQNELARQTGAVEVRINDLSELLSELGEKNIYRIARVVVFQDPNLAEARHDLALKTKSGGVWRDWKGLAWVDPSRKEVWDYNLALAAEVASLGFDEVNFDYIRFPSDGNINQIDFGLTATRGKNEVMADFFKHLGYRMAFIPVRTSGDVFGMTLWRSDGMNIGQRYADVSPYFDYIAPMVYPSHYPPSFEGFANPADHPYEIIYRSLIRAERNDGTKALLRPWLQDFDLGAVYTPEMIRLQKVAAVEAGASGWMLWNASNVYTVGGLDQE